MLAATGGAASRASLQGAQLACGGSCNSRVLLWLASRYADAGWPCAGTDTMAYSASALSLMLVGFRKPIVMTGSQLPLAMPRRWARRLRCHRPAVACCPCVVPGPTAPALF